MDPLTGSVQHYAWGSTTALPEFLGVEPDGRPQAELWLGAHHSAPSRVGDQSLADVIAADSDGVVGEAAVGEFGAQLPYLLKVLAAAQPLSLQAHPSRAGAEAGFAREEESGLDRGAPTRLYRDDWPKPEMFVALGDVEALCGFREPDETYALFARLGVPAATDLVAPLRGGGPDQLAVVFARVLGLTDGERAVVAQVVTASAELVEGGDAAADADLARFARTAVELDEHFPGDPGVLAALLMNRMGFGRFQGLFLPAGNLHAYLQGIGVEIMANSDNVMRGGLTPKHVDVSELLAILDFTPGVPPLVDVVAESTGVWRYRTPAPEFALWRVEADPAGVRLPAAESGRVVLVVEGAVEIGDGTVTRPLARGAAVYGYPGEELTVTGDGIVMMAAPGI
ncbi:MAG TPA: mannose-6-phosphate isomerase, class I [Microlunatus sp.]